MSGVKGYMIELHIATSIWGGGVIKFGLEEGGRGWVTVMEVSRPDLMGLGLVSRFKGLGLARDHSIGGENENRGMKKALGRW